ncbi:rhodanese-like domain-containing protein [Leptolyngbya sp. PCC 6406]|uniref:rhodanese-like domain-containing protein n=1 Tax=Leptolyngbya sp. PCC 6406 TaxID=1173264 RepID=UPI000486AEA0|nr:rhodanese-like domain-containing protein [Leptolyngbya sp. PCC 6406]
MTSSPAFQDIDVETLAQVLATADPEVQLVDVREPQELELAAIAGFENLPLSQFAEWGDTIHSRLAADRETIVLCHHGMRSAQMCQWLLSQGFTAVKNVTGGIDVYSVRVDPAVPRY